MADSNYSQTLDNLPRASAVSPKALTLVQEPGGPTSSLPVEALVGRLIGTATATATYADLSTQLGYDANTTALVFADPNPAASGWYRKVGASGSGNWALFEQLGTAAVSAAFAQADRAEAAAGRAIGQKCELTVVIGQSLTIGRGPTVTAPNAVVLGALCFNGGCETPTMATLPGDFGTQPVPPVNYASLAPLFQPAGVETWGPGLTYQAAKAGALRCFFFAPGAGSQSARTLHGSFMQNLRHGLYRAVKLLRAAGLEPTIDFVIDQGHADADATDDGGNPTMPTPPADWTLAWRKNIATMRLAASQALGYQFTGAIFVVPLLTQNSVASLSSRRDIVMAQVGMPAAIAGTHLLPPRSQFANLFSPDLTHPYGSGYRYFAELVGAYKRSGLTPPTMTGKALAGGKVVVTFDQPLKFMATPDAGSPVNSRDGFTVIDNTGTEVAVTATAIAANTVTLTVASTVNLSGSWFVRNGLQLLSPLGNSGDPVQFMPRTRVAGVVDAGIAQDGTPLQNLSLPQEL